MKPFHPNTKFVFVSYAIVLGLLLVCSFSFSQLQTLVLINGTNTQQLDLFFSMVTHFGNGVLLVPVTIALLFRRFFMSVALVASGVVQGIAVLLCKRVFFTDAIRPLALFKEIPFHKVSGVDIHYAMSFPSGHTVTAFGICVFLSLCYRNMMLTFILLLIALMVGLSRVYLLQHFLMDVACGAVIGFGTALMAYHLFSTMSSPKWLNERLELTISSPFDSGKSIRQNNRFRAFK
jgi:membrane-associated phospholipid phosphatase